MVQITLEAARVNMGYNAQEAAKKLDIHWQTLRKYEKDSSDLPVSLLKKMVLMYRIPEDHIFLGSDIELTRKRLNI